MAEQTTCASVSTSSTPGNPLAGEMKNSERANGKANSSHFDGTKNTGQSINAAAARRSPGLNRPRSTLSKRTVLLRFLRLFFIDLPLLLAFTTFLIMYSVRHVHDKYFRILYEQAERTDEQLLEEFTYYKRDCNAYDLTATRTSNLDELLLVDSRASTNSNLERFMTHGAMIFPDLLSPDEATDLRNYIQQRNAQVTEAEAYPVSQGEHRISYGIEPTEDAAVAHAVKMITINPTFRSMITTILGDYDPASAEITAITCSYGCPPQLWHSDTKAVGNALFYARTYAHSYSIFVPLQNTTTDMGITDFAPGTQYCGNDISILCEGHGVHLTDAMSDGVFPAGYGALFNQHVWHRGGAHVDPNAPERIVFILSFLARPKPKDPRMLARGTYFHQKWSMWGMTYFDLMDPYVTMGKPWSILRCLSIWKPWNRNWGWDLITSSYLRFANGQMQDDDFYDRFLPRLDELMVPMWLRGDVMYDAPQKIVWSHFIQGTINNAYAFVKAACLGVHGVYAILSISWIVAFPGGVIGAKVSVIRSFRQTLLWYCTLSAAAFLLLMHIDHSAWGQSVINGQIWKRPFSSSVQRNIDAAMISAGPTTLPTQEDVLIGSRFDATFLGSYDQWLNFHPGNVKFQSIVETASKMFASLDIDASSGLKQHLLHHVQSASTSHDGRFLQQDYISGDWRVMAESEAIEIVHLALAAARNDYTAHMAKVLDYLVADFRFGPLRDTALASLLQRHIWDLKRLMLRLPRRKLTLPKRASTGSTLKLPIRWAIRNSLSTRLNSIIRQSAFQSSLPSDNEIRSGSHAWTYFDDEYMKGWFPSTVLSTEYSDSYLVSYDDGSEDLVNKQIVHKRAPLLEGDQVVSCLRPNYQECHPGRITRVMPNQDVSIAYDDGRTALRVSSEYYYRPPYSHITLMSDGDDDDTFDEDIDTDDDFYGDAGGDNDDNNAD
ncbi:hypothetical protein MPSEU_000845200 [Mayamaea pseudoterrestris]|nr:hypothetical protein MPSEU_000845200 [Mayamaea pseudoterrestris]